MVDILQSEGIAPPASWKQGGELPQGGRDILAEEGIAPPASWGKTPAQEAQIAPSGLSMDIARHPELAKAVIGAGHYSKDVYDRLISNPVVNAGVSAGQSFGQSVDNAINLVLRTHLKPTELSDPARVSSVIGKYLGLGAAYAAGSEFLVPAIGAAGKLAPTVSKALTRVPGFVQRMAGGAAYGATQQPGSPLWGAALGAAISPLADLAGLTAKGVAGGLRSPIRASKQAAQSLLRRTFGAEMFPTIRGHVNQILDGLRGSSSRETSNEDLFDIIKQHYDELRKGSDEGAPAQYVAPGQSVGDAYNKLTELIPQKEGYFDRGAFDKQINSSLKNIEDRVGPLAKTTELKQSLESLKPIVSDFKNVRLNNFQDADFLKRYINETARNLKHGDPVAPYLHQLNDALRVSVGDSAQTAGPKVAAAWKNADLRYKNEIVPFKQSATGKITPFMKRNLGKAEINGMTSEYISPGSQKDQAQKLQGLMKLLPSDGGAARKLVAYDYLKETEDNPVTFLKTYNRLGLKQKALLLPEYKNELDRLTGLLKKYPAAFKESKFGLKETAMGGITATLGAHMGAHVGMPWIGGVAGATVPVVAKRAMARALEERPELSQFILKELEKPIVGPLASAIQASMGGVPGQIVRGGLLGELLQRNQ